MKRIMKITAVVLLVCAALSASGCAGFVRDMWNLPSEKTTKKADRSDETEYDTEADADSETEEEEDSDNVVKGYFTVKYEIKNGKAVVTGYSGEGDSAVIRSEYEDKDVVGIEDGAFEDCTALRSVSIWADIEYIGDSAFKNCTSLESISIPSETETIGSHAFENCVKLKSLSIWGDPDIGDYAFAGCEKISSISIGSETERVGSHAFDGCLEAKVYLWGCGEVCEYAFARCGGIESLSFSSDVKLIRNHAFDSCPNLEKVYIWSVETVAEADAFSNCPKLKEVYDAAKKERGSSAKETQKETEKKAGDEVSVSVREVADAYEALVDEYVAFMKNYNPSDLSALTKYLELLNKCNDYLKKVENMKSDASTSDLIYLNEVINRCSKKMIEAAGN